jgi:hypothetical protein
MDCWFNELHRSAELNHWRSTTRWVYTRLTTLRNSQAWLQQEQQTHCNRTSAASALRSSSARRSSSNRDGSSLACLRASNDEQRCCTSINVGQGPATRTPPAYTAMYQHAAAPMHQICRLASHHPTSMCANRSSSTRKLSHRAALGTARPLVAKPVPLHSEELAIRCQTVARLTHHSDHPTLNRQHHA